jgi:hypothetical protein
MSIISKELNYQLCRGIFNNVACKFPGVSMVASCSNLLARFCGILY